MASLTDVVRGKVMQDGRTIYAIARASGLDASHLARFMGGKGGLTSASMDRLWDTLRMGASTPRVDHEASPTTTDTAPRVAPHRDSGTPSTPSASFQSRKLDPRAARKLGLTR